MYPCCFFILLHPLKIVYTVPMNIKMTHIFASIIILASSSTTPVVALAAVNTDGADGFTRGLLIWRKGTSAMQDAIQKLDDQKVQDIPLPVLFGVDSKNLSKNFGDQRSNHAHAGLDIMVAEGTPVVSPTDAVVIRISFDAGSGNYVMVAAPGGESFAFMHLSRVAKISVGDVLTPGDVIGYVGHTGNAIATAPHLHFEVRDQDGIATDPFNRLTKGFTSKEKMIYLTAILENDTDNEQELAELLVTQFRTDFIAAKAEGVTLPDDIGDVLKDTTIVVTGTPSAVPSINIYVTLLKVGSRGDAVVALQSYLIKKGIGSGVKIVADGVFGSMTRQAVIEYQVSVGLVADGVAGPKTLTYIQTH